MKREIVNVQQKLHIAQYGHCFPITETRSLGGGNLFIDRPFVDHPTCKRLQMHLLPAWGWQVCRYLDARNRETGLWDWYVDIARIEDKRGNLIVNDLYLDVGVHEGRSYQVLDLDEFSAALAVGEISPTDSRWALESLHRLVELLAAHGFQMEKVLALALERSPATAMSAASSRHARRV